MARSPKPPKPPPAVADMLRKGTPEEIRLKQPEGSERRRRMDEMLGVHGPAGTTYTPPPGFERRGTPRPTPDRRQITKGPNPLGQPTPDPMKRKRPGPAVGPVPRPKPDDMDLAAGSLAKRFHYGVPPENANNNVTRAPGGRATPPPTRRIPSPAGEPPPLKAPKIPPLRKPKPPKLPPTGGIRGLPRAY